MNLQWEKLRLFFIRRMLARGGLLADMCLGELFHAVLIFAVDEGRVENINNVELRDSGGHGSTSEGGLIRAGVEPIVC